MVEPAVVIEELAAALMPVASTLALHLDVAMIVEWFGTEVQRNRFCPAMASFDTVGAKMSYLADSRNLSSWPVFRDR